LIWREHLGCQIESIMSCHVITRDELYDLCLQQWVGFGHLGSEFPRIYRLVFIPSPSKSAEERALETFTSSRWTEKAALIFNVPGQAGHCKSNPSECTHTILYIESLLLVNVSEILEI
jgi:hypothetical protein